MNRTPQLTYLRSKPVLIAIVVAIVVILIWLVAFFFPENSKASKLQAQDHSLQSQVARDNAKLVALRATSKATPQLRTLEAQYASYVPAQPDVLNGPSPYVDMIDSTATRTGIKLTSITPGSVTAVPGLAFSGIPVSIAATGTYDALLSFIKAVYQLPRLTSIQSVSISGGGPTTNRGSTLTASMSLEVYTMARPAS